MTGAPRTTLDAARKAGATVAYGHFITLLINFLIVAWVLFLVVKGMNRLKRTEAEQPARRPPRRRTWCCCAKIRDLLAKR